MKLKIDWKGLAKTYNYSRQTFENGECPAMAWLLHELMPDSIFLVCTYYDDSEGRHYLHHCVVEYQGETYDCGGQRAVERWMKHHKDISNFEEISSEDFDGFVEDTGGFLSMKVVDNLRPFVKVTL